MGSEMCIRDSACHELHACEADGVDGRVSLETPPPRQPPPLEPCARPTAAHADSGGGASALARAFATGDPSEQSRLLTHRLALRVETTPAARDERASATPNGHDDDDGDGDGSESRVRSDSDDEESDEDSDANADADADGERAERRFGRRDELGRGRGRGGVAQLGALAHSTAAAAAAATVQLRWLSRAPHPSFRLVLLARARAPDPAGGASGAHAAWAASTPPDAPWWMAAHAASVAPVEIGAPHDEAVAALLERVVALGLARLPHARTSAVGALARLLLPPSAAADDELSLIHI